MIIDDIKHTLDACQDIEPETLGQLLALTDAHDLQRLYACADECNEKRNGSSVSFVCNRNINYTNRCDIHCSFCAYYSASDEDAYIISNKDVSTRIASLDISEVSIQGGLSTAVSFAHVRLK